MKGLYLRIGTFFVILEGAFMLLDFLDSELTKINYFCKNFFKMPKISNRALHMPASPMRKLIPYALKAKKNGTKVYHLNIGQPDIETPYQFWEAIKNIDRKVLEYSPSNGFEEVRIKYATFFQKRYIPRPEWYLGWTIKGYTEFDVSASLVRLSKFGLIELMFDRTAGSDEYDWSLKGRLSRLEQKLTWR